MQLINTNIGTEFPTEHQTVQAFTGSHKSHIHTKACIEDWVSLKKKYFMCTSHLLSKMI